jgi:hypothetical protein
MMPSITITVRADDGTEVLSTTVTPHASPITTLGDGDGWMWTNEHRPRLVREEILTAAGWGIMLAQRHDTPRT